MRTLNNAIFVPMLKQGTNEIVANFGFALQALITDLEYIIEAWTREEIKKLKNIFRLISDKFPSCIVRVAKLYPMTYIGLAGQNTFL